MAGSYCSKIQANGHGPHGIGALKIAQNQISCPINRAGATCQWTQQRQRSIIDEFIKRRGWSTARRELAANDFWWAARWGQQLPTMGFRSKSTYPLTKARRPLIDRDAKSRAPAGIQLARAYTCTYASWEACDLRQRCHGRRKTDALGGNRTQSAQSSSRRSVGAPMLKTDCPWTVARGKFNSLWCVDNQTRTKTTSFLHLTRSLVKKTMNGWQKYVYKLF
jgi:hypothetical protein